MLDERERAGDLWRERDEHDAAAGGVLPAIEVLCARRPHVRPLMRAARAIVRGNVRPFHVDSGDGLVRHARDDARASRKVVERRSDEGRERARHPAARIRSSARLTPSAVRSGRVEIHAAESH